VVRMVKAARITAEDDILGGEVRGEDANGS
jgi:hypothetical protein